MKSSLPQLVGRITLASASIAFCVVLGPLTSNPFFLFVELLLAGLLFLTGYAAFDPWLESPAYLQRKWPKRPGQYAKTGGVTWGLVIVLPVVIGVPASLVLGLILSGGSLDQGSPDEFTAAWFADWLAIAWHLAGIVVVGASTVGLFTLFRGAPLGPGFARVFFLSVSAMVGAFLTILISWLAHQLAETAGPLGNYSPYALERMINKAMTGGIGLVLLYAGWLIGGRYAQELIGFGRCARRWSARCLLLGSLLGGCSAAFYSWIVPIVPALRSAFVPLGGVIGAIVMANIGALLCARWEKHLVESDSELRKEK